MKFSKILIATALLLTLGCTKGKEDIVIILKQQKGQPLAEVGNLTLTLEEMKNDFLDRQGNFQGAPNLNTEKARNDYVESQVMQKAMFLEALKRDYFDRADVKRDIEKIVVQKWVRDELEKAQNEFVPTDEQVQEHYKKNPNFYNRDEAVKMAYISIPFGDNRAKTKEIATMIHKDAVETVKNANSREFSRLAMKHATKVMEAGQVSVETNETDYLDKPAFEAQFGPNSFDSIKAIETIGKIGPLIATDKAFVITMKTGTRKALNESIEDARPKIVKRLAYDSRQEYYKKLTEELRKKYNIKVYSEHVAELSKGAPEKNMVKNETPPGTENKEEPLNIVREAQKEAAKPNTR